MRIRPAKTSCEERHSRFSSALNALKRIRQLRCNQKVAHTHLNDDVALRACDALIVDEEARELADAVLHQSEQLFSLRAGLILKDVAQHCER